MEQVHFAPLSKFKPGVDALFAEQAIFLRKLVPRSDIQHVGSTALTECLTKGDLDIQVRVSAADFETAKTQLLQHYTIIPGGFTEPDGRSCKDERTVPPVGVHLTVIGGSCDVQWRIREVLRKQADLRERYDSLKRRFHGKSMDDYRVAKADFFEELRATAEYQTL